MRRLTARDERGSVVIITALVFVVFFGIGAVVVDMGAVLHEKRVLQNGADAAALAIAEACGADECTDPAAIAADYASANAQDGVSGIDDLCGDGLASLPACTNPPPDLPAGASYVQVTTDTVADDGSGLVPFDFGHVFGLSGVNVRARAIAAWGGPASLTADLPLTISMCEFEAYTSGQTDLQDPPPYDVSGYPSDPESVIYLHDTTEAGPPCAAGPSGADLPGGFGWLSTEDDCQAYTVAENWYDDNTGRPPPTSCSVAMMASLVGTVVKIPVFVETNGLTGTNGHYRIGQYAAFYLTGYSIVGQYKVASQVTGSYPCTGQASCIAGYFVDWPFAVGGTIGGASTGVTVVELVG